MSEWYDRRGRVIRGTDEPAGSEAWRVGMRAADILLNDPDYKVIARSAYKGTERRELYGVNYDADPDEVVVSTVWIGLNHAWDDSLPPVIFETMVFGGRLDQEQDRYRTVAEARAGHEAMCALVVQAQRDDADQVIR